MSNNNADGPSGGRSSEKGNGELSGGSASEGESRGRVVLPAELGEISTPDDLKTFLRTVLDKMSDDQSAPVYSLSLMNHLMNRPDMYRLFDKESKELARDLWLRLKASGVQIRNPPFLFTPESSGS